MQTTRILRNTGVTLTYTWEVDGTATDPTGNTTTVTLTRADGTAFATDAATTRTGTGVYTYTLTPQAALELFTVEWKATFSGQTTKVLTYAEIVGGHLFTESQARAFKVGNTAVLTAALYSDSELAEARDRITDLLERRTGISWVPRFGRFSFNGNGAYEVQLPHRNIISLQSVSIGGTAQTIGNYDVDPDTGIVYAKASTFTAATYSTPRNVVIEYEYGKQHIEDGVDRIALRWLMATVVRNNTPDRAMTVTNEIGNMTLAPFNPSGDPEVDAWCAAHDERNPVG
jgi:hypothetical protein